MRHIYSKDFKYRKAVETDIAATFKRIRAEQQKNAAEVVAKVKPLPKVRAA
jgi:hypothetical protein